MGIWVAAAAFAARCTVEVSVIATALVMSFGSADDMSFVIMGSLFGFALVTTVHALT